MPDVRDPADNADDPRHRFIARVAKGKSFIDIGGLSGGTSERVSVAHKAGARSLALMDVEGPDCPWWDLVRERLGARGVGECVFISGDVLTYDLPVYDIVFSSGVLYHLPAPLTYLSRLRQITGEYCILASTTVPTRIAVDDRELRIPSASVIFVPALDGPEKDLFVEWYRLRGRSNIAEAEERFGGYRNLANYYPNWFLPTVGSMRAMAVSAGFAIVDEAPVEPEELSHCLLLRSA
jgi:hypothetical protein